MSRTIISFLSIILLFTVNGIAVTGPAGDAKATIQGILVGGVAQPELDDITKLEIKRADDGRLEAAKVGSQLFVNDEIKTTAGVEVSLVFTDPASTFRIEVFVLENSKAKIGSLFGFFGGFYLRGWGIFDTETKYVRLAKRGTKFKFEVNQNGDVELSVLAGEVEVEQLPLPIGPASARRERSDRFMNAGYAKSMSAQRVRTVTGLHSVTIKPNEPIPEPRKMKELELSGLLDKTDILEMATMPGFRPNSNVLPATFALGTDDAINKARSEAAFKAARREAILNPNATNQARLGDAYKDLGSGERAVVEYDYAAKADPKLTNSVNFLVGQSEAYRLSGDLPKATERLTAAVKLLSADSPTAAWGRYFTTAGNVSLDKGHLSLTAQQKDNALLYFSESKFAYDSANKYVWDPSYGEIFATNNNNIRLAFFSNPKLGTFTPLNGTYDGELKFEPAGIDGPAVLIVTGNRFSLGNEKVSLKGTVVAGEKSADGAQLYDFTFDSGVTIQKVALIARCESEKRLALTNAANEKIKLAFSAQPRQAAAKCLQPSKVRSYVITTAAGKPQ